MPAAATSSAASTPEASDGPAPTAVDASPPGPEAPEVGRRHPVGPGLRALRRALVAGPVRRRWRSTRRRVGPLLFVASAGGHLGQLRPVRAALPQGLEVVWVTFDKADGRSLRDEGGDPVHFAHHPTTRHLPNLVRNLVLAARLVLRVRPAVVVSSGAGVALPYLALAWLTGRTTVYLEVIDRISSRTLTGTLCYPLADHFLVQSDAQCRLYPGAELVGPVL